MKPRELLVACLLPLAADVQVARAEAIARRHESARVLRSEHLHVEVMNPAAAEPYYRGNRFTPLANVLRVAMDGRDFLHSPVEHDPRADNAGLATEFDLRQWQDGGPPGFVDAVEGGSFLKVGVGVLKKAGDEYGFYKPYEVVSFAPVEAEWREDGAVFRQRCEAESGYAYRYEAEVRVRARTLEIEYRLENSGRLAFATEQYAHNFFAFEGAGVVGPGYELEFSRPFTFEEFKSQVLRVDGRRIRFGEGIAPRKAITSMVVPVPSPEAEEIPDSVLVRHVATGMAIRSTVSRPTAQTAVHASPRYLCAEQFVRVRLQPGETATWRRTYDFILETNAQK